MNSRSLKKKKSLDYIFKKHAISIKIDLQENLQQY